MNDNGVSYYKIAGFDRARLETDTKKTDPNINIQFEPYPEESWVHASYPRDWFQLGNLLGTITQKDAHPQKTVFFTDFMSQLTQNKVEDRLGYDVAQDTPAASNLKQASRTQSKTNSRSSSYTTASDAIKKHRFFACISDEGWKVLKRGNAKDILEKFANFECLDPRE